MNWKEINAELPQTQCRQCGYDGCTPYAKAVAAGESVSLCLPGGNEVAQLLAALTRRVCETLDEPPKTLALIDEAHCIGCTACVKACPVDAILGASKLMHTVIENECTGCGLCVAPCPVDCIVLNEVADAYLPRAALLEISSDERENQAPQNPRKAAATYALQRFETRNRRLEKLKEERTQFLARQARVATSSEKSSKQAEKSGEHREMSNVAAQSSSAAANPHGAGSVKALNPAELIAKAMQNAAIRQQMTIKVHNQAHLAWERLVEEQRRAAHRRALRDLQHGTEEERRAALAFLKEKAPAKV